VFAAAAELNRKIWPALGGHLAIAMSAVSLYYYLQVLKRFTFECARPARRDSGHRAIHGCGRVIALVSSCWVGARAVGRQIIGGHPVGGLLELALDFADVRP